MFVADLPEARCIGVGRHAFKHERRRPIGERAVNYIGMTRDPADIGAAPINVIFFEVENRLMGQAGPNEIAARCMQHAFGLACRA